MHRVFLSPPTQYEKRDPLLTRSLTKWMVVSYRALKFEHRAIEESLKFSEVSFTGLYSEFYHKRGSVKKGTCIR